MSSRICAGEGIRPHPIWGALTDFSIFELPVFISVVGWAAVSYVITGDAIQRVTLVTSSTVKAKAVRPTVLLHIGLRDIMYLAPTIPLVLLVAAYLAFRKRDVGLLAPLSVLGGGILFSLLILINKRYSGIFPLLHSYSSVERFDCRKFIRNRSSYNLFGASTGD